MRAQNLLIITKIIGKQTFYLLAALFLFFCEDNGTNNRDDLGGTYQCIFYRNSAPEDFDTANVTIEFSANTWNGTSNIPKYPALCSGTYSINSDSIHFNTYFPGHLATGRSHNFQYA
jgi:hypothetical protein